MSNDDESLITIVLSESATEVLDWNVAGIGETSADGRDQIYAIRPIDWRTLVEAQDGIVSYYFRDHSLGKDSPAVTSEVAYFSYHYPSDSMDSIPSIDNDEIMDHEMEPVCVLTKPLLRANTAAHENKITMRDNTIYVTVKDDENSATNSEWICRICHGGESLGDLLSPCNCKGTIALAHLECLEHWLRESSNSYCELCKHHFDIIRQPKYGTMRSIMLYLIEPGENLRETLLDFMAFVVYTPSAITTTYMLMSICENVARSQLHRTRNVSAHMIVFCAVFGMAAIDFTYTSWLIVTLQKHVNAWRMWCRSNSLLKLILPERKLKPYKAYDSITATQTTEEFD